jgi:hypothetical protein
MAGASPQQRLHRLAGGCLALHADAGQPSGLSRVGLQMGRIPDQIGVKEAKGRRGGVEEDRHVGGGCEAGREHHCRLRTFELEQDRVGGTAKDAADYDRATELEAADGRVVELASAEWKALAA